MTTNNSTGYYIPNHQTKETFFVRRNATEVISNHHYTDKVFLLSNGSKGKVIHVVRDKSDGSMLLHMEIQSPVYTQNTVWIPLEWVNVPRNEQLTNRSYQKSMEGVKTLFQKLS